MSRPKDKKELLELSQYNFDRLIDYIEDLSHGVQHSEFPAGTLNRNISDVLAHLHHWHLMLLNWYSVGMKGEKPDMPSKEYTWKETAKLNAWIREQYKNMDLKDAKSKLRESHQAIMKIVSKHTNEELFEKKRYPWTGSTSLGAYLISSTSSHYDWAFKLIRKCHGMMSLKK